MTRHNLNVGLKLAAVVIAGAVGAMQALGDGPLTAKDAVTIVGGILAAVFGYLHTAPTDKATMAVLAPSKLNAAVTAKDLEKPVAPP